MKDWRTTGVEEDNKSHIKLTYLHSKTLYKDLIPWDLEAGILCKELLLVYSWEYWVIAWGRWRGDFFPSGRWCWIGPLMVVSPPEPYFLPLIKHLRFFYSHVFQWCIVLLASLIYANPWIDYECMLLVVSFSCLICRISCSWAREKTWSWEQAAIKGDWIDHLRKTSVSGSLPFISCMS